MKSKWNFFFIITVLSFLQSETVNENEFRRPAVPREESDLKDYRLPATIVPTYYDLSILLKKDFSFHGVVKINATVLETTDEIVLHYGKIKVTTTSVLTNNQKLDLLSTEYDPITEKYSIKLQEVLRERTEFLIAIAYDGVVQDGFSGFYKMGYVNNKGETREIAATQFVPVHARHAFPCFDEPAFKAIFKIRIQRPSEYTTLSNMPLVRSVFKGFVTNDFFEESVQMSTYLVAFVISDLKSAGNDSIKVWAREDAINQAKYALKIGTEILEYLEFIFVQNYQISKMDMVALPTSYFGAMENWGLIIYGESSLLYDETESSDAFQQNVAEVIAHEYTHMWFGNLVTPDWWGFLWLSKAFARYYQFYVFSQIEPKWKMSQQFLLRQLNAFIYDALPSSAPLTRSVYNQSEIIDMADVITHDKGASILRMMELSFGSDLFSSTIQSYLEARKYNTGKPEDFFARIQIQISSRLDASVETIMNTWTKQSGYPVLSVTVTDDQVKLSQQQFFLRKPNSVSSVDQTWWIPITWASKSNPSFTVTTTDKWINGEKTIKVEREKDDWIVFNLQSAGFYRISYDTKSWYRIIDTLKSNTFTSINVINRAAIIDDLLNLARADFLDYNVALDGLEYLKQETSYLPFKAAFNSLDYLTQRFSGQPEYNVYSKYVLRLIKIIHQTVGFVDGNNDDRLTILLRRELNFQSCSLGLQDCISRSLKYFINWKNGLNFRVPKNLKRVVYRTAIKHGTEEDWEFLWSKYQNTNVISERVEILNALACTQNPKVLGKYLRLASFNFDGHRMHQSDINGVFNTVSSCTLFGAEFVLDFVDKYYKEITDSNGGDYGYISKILSQASKYLSTRNLVEKFEQLIQTHYIDFKPIMPSLRSQLELAKYELNWYSRNSRKITNWIKSHKSL